MQISFSPKGNAGETCQVQDGFLSQKNIFPVSMPFKNLVPFPKLGCRSLGSYRPRNRASIHSLRKALEFLVVLHVDMAFLLIHLWLNLKVRVAVFFPTSVRFHLRMIDLKHFY